MVKSVNLIGYLPPILRDKVHYIEICKAKNSEHELIFTSLDNILKDQFLSTLTINGVKRWEKIMKITPRASETLEDRRFRIQNRFLNKVPYTMTTLKNTLNTLCGENGYKISYDENTYTLTIRLELSVKNQMDEVIRNLKHMIPTNIVQDISLLYNQHLTLAKFTHTELSRFTHKQLREEEITHARNS